MIRGTQSYVFNLLLSDELLPAPIVYGSLCPVIGFYCVKKFILDPYQSAAKQRKEDQFRQENSRQLQERKRQAQVSIELMRETYDRSLERERNTNGLLVLRAVYGNRINLEPFVQRFATAEQLDEVELLQAELADVTVPLQCMVRGSTLQLPTASKVQKPFVSQYF